MRQKYKIPFEFILDYLNTENLNIKPMFGCFGIYNRDKMVFFLRDRIENRELNGVWVATTAEHAESLSKTLPSLVRDLKLIENKKSNGTWLLISTEDDNFEALVVKACELVIKEDIRIGKTTKGVLEIEDLNERLKDK